MRNILMVTIGMFISNTIFAQQNNAKPNIAQKVNNTANRVTTLIAVFQPYLLKARQLFYDAKQLAGDVKNKAKNNFGKNAIANNGTTAGAYPGNNNNNYSSGNNDSLNSNNYPNNTNNGNYGSNQGNNDYNSGSQGSGNNNTQNNNNGYNQGASNPQYYLPDQNLPINNAATVNNDGTGNWGNQNNGLYGNCLDVLTGTVMGMGDAAQSPASVDLMFFAPADGQNTYFLITPGFARNNNSVTYWTEHTSDQVMQWTDANETEVALTKLTIAQFNQIQNNSQIQNAVRNAQNYAGYYSSVDQKLDGKVFAIKAQMENREVYALVAVVKQIGTSGSNGYLKINIKAQAVGTNGSAQINANSYIR